MRASLSTLLTLGLPLALWGCPNTTNPTDGGSDASSPDASDAAPADADPCATPEAQPLHSVYPAPAFVRVGGTARVRLRLQRDLLRCPADYDVTVENTGFATAPASVHIDRGGSFVEFDVTGVAAGQTNLRVAQRGVAPTMDSATTAQLNVLAPAVPDCPAATPSVMGMLSTGGRVGGAAGGPLQYAGISVAMSAREFTTRALTVGCATQQVPAGYTAIGPAIRFAATTAEGARRFEREVNFSLPINPALVPSMYELQTQVLYTPPCVAASGRSCPAPRMVPLTNTRFGMDGRSLAFESSRLGTFQAVVRTDLGQRRTRRHFTYRGILGFSMGGIGSSTIGLLHHELFDFIAPMGAPAEWNWFGDYVRNYIASGFCSAAQRAGGMMDCAGASNTRNTPPDDLWTVNQNFEFFNSTDGRDGNGGTFDRQSYTQLLRDLSAANGNPLMPSAADTVLPLGVPATEQMRSDSDRCAHPVRLTGFYDDEYNPDGSLPVITFCDGAHTSAHTGEWTTGGNFPFEVALAVDYNDNGVRDRGEPVLRDMSEPFDDFGTDGVPSSREPGYDALLNPDPAGDDYDRQFNPSGTEGNHVYEMGEPYRDVGLDGVVCPTGRTCQYDFGEGNGQFDYARGAQQLLRNNPRNRLQALGNAEADRLAVWSDGGTRDLFNFGTVSNHFVGGVHQATQNNAYLFHNYSALMTGRPYNTVDDSAFVFTDVDWAHVPRHSGMLYGFDDATPEQIQMGDGAHVGTIEQVTSRIYAAMWWAQAHWPGVDRLASQPGNRVDDAGRCANGYVCTFDFRSDRANRTGQVAIALPAGYHQAANQGVRYPVIYFLHGYGMDPSSLRGTAILIGNYQTDMLAGWQRPGKFIMVFPDGRCRDGDGCIRGTFFANSSLPAHGQLDTFFLDLFQWVDSSFRTMPAADVDVVE